MYTVSFSSVCLKFEWTYRSSKHFFLVLEVLEISPRYGHTFNVVQEYRQTNIIIYKYTQENIKITSSSGALHFKFRVLRNKDIIVKIQMVETSNVTLEYHVSVQYLWFKVNIFLIIFLIIDLNIKVLRLAVYRYYMMYSYFITFANIFM